MNVLTLLKLFGRKAAQKAIADALRKHATAQGYAGLAASLDEAALGARTLNAEQTAGGIADALFSIK